MQSDANESAWEATFKLLLKPRLLLQAIVEYFSAWVFTRRWLLWILLLSPAWILIVAITGLVSYGALIDRGELAQRYADWIEEEIPTADLDASGTSETDDQATGDAEATPAAETPSPPPSATDSSPDQDILSDAGLESLKDVSQYGDLLLRRLLVLRNSNSRISYLVAARLQREGRAGQARQMMRRIAPEGGGGYPPAHSWLAVDRLRQGQVTTQEDKELLAADFATASQWSKFPAELLAIYAQLLEGQNQIGPALAVLDQASERDSRFSVALANMAARHGRDQSRQRASTRARDEIKLRMEQKTETVEDLASLANIFLLEKDAERALTVIGMGLEKESDNASLKRLQSIAYLTMYAETAKISRESTNVNLGLLDAALKSDPTNPAVGVEVARLMAAGQEASPELTQALEDQLASGAATAVTHILLANRLLRDGKLAEAIPHLRIADRQAPQSPVILNNLALALARTDKDALPEALRLVDRAVSGAPNNAQFLDTQGEIRHMSGDILGAVESYEAAIGSDNSRNDIRARLVEVYRELGMNEMAKAQEKAIQAATDQP